MSLTLVILILLLVFVVGAYPAWPHSSQWGYAPSGLGTILVVLLVLMLLGVIPHRF